MKNYGHKEPIKVRLMDLVVLLTNTLRGNEKKDIGFEDANQSIMQLIQNLNREVIVEVSEVESMLWSCGLLDEENEFWHPRHLDFKAFVKNLIGRDLRMDPVTFIIEKVRK